MNAQAHYIRLYKQADEILRQPDNPCQIQLQDGVATCVASRAGLEPNGTLCCTGCKHLGEDGCTAMSLGCKLGWCVEGFESIPGTQWNETFKQISLLRREAILLHIPLRVRQSYRENFSR